MLLSKYVESKFFKNTLQGKLKFGTLEEYRRYEDGADLRLSDYTEGVEERLVYEEIINQPFGSGTITSFGNGGANFALKHKFNAYVICFSFGSYNKNHHREFHEKNKSNLPNYVVFDLDKFLSVTNEMSKVYLSNGVIEHDKITYLDTKAKIVPFSEIQTGSPNRKEATFTKESRFLYENEYRIAIFADDIKGSLFTENFSSDVINSFAESIVNYGSL